MLHVLEHTLIESLKMLPFLFLAYLIIEFIENRASGKLVNILTHSRYSSSLAGAVLGSFPQCGFSVTAANLYAGGLISLGTLLAVFISTSDEAIPVLLSYPGQMGELVKLILAKIGIAFLAGILIDFLIKKRKNEDPGIRRKERTEYLCRHCHCHKSIWKSALVHTLQIFLFVLVFMLVINTAVHFIGEDRLYALFLRDNVLQPAVAALVGLIPNCSISIVITRLFVEGGLSFGAAIAGLSSGAGVGLIVLFRSNKNLRESLLIVLLLYLVSTAAGTLLHLFL